MESYSTTTYNLTESAHKVDDMEYKVVKKTFAEKLMKETRKIRHKKALKQMHISQPLNFQHLIHWPYNESKC